MLQPEQRYYVKILNFVPFDLKIQKFQNVTDCFEFCSNLDSEPLKNSQIKQKYKILKQPRTKFIFHQNMHIFHLLNRTSK